MLNLNDLDDQIYTCTLCGNLVEHFPKSKTVSLGKNNDIVIVGEAPANNGWRKSGKAFYTIDGNLLPSGKVLQQLLDILNIKLSDVCFLEAIKCYPKERKNLKTCSLNCNKFLLKQLEIIKPKLVLTLGLEASKSVLRINFKKFSEIVGKEYKLGDITVIPIYHPSPISPLSYKGNEEIFNNIKQKVLVK